MVDGCAEPWRRDGAEKQIMSTRYKGIARPSGGGCTVTFEGEVLHPRHDLRNHSPEGFQWGYAGSGPAQLALAILAHHTRDDDKAVKHYQRFKFDVLARWPGDKDLVLSTNSIQTWLNEQE